MGWVSRGLILVVWGVVLCGCSATDTPTLDRQSVPSRVSHHGYPKLGNNTQVEWAGNAGNGFLGQALFERLYWYDYVVISADAATGSLLPAYLGPSGTIRQRNPNAVMVGYFSPADFLDDTTAVRYRKLMRTYAFGPTYDYLTNVDSDPTDGFQKDEWIFKDIHGSYVLLFHFPAGHWSTLQNVTIAAMREHFVNTFNEVIVSLGLYDGIYHDWASHKAPDMGDPTRDNLDMDQNGVSEVVSASAWSDPVNVAWRAGLTALYQLGRATYPAGFILTGNSGWFNEPAYTDYLQGTMMETMNEALDANAYPWGDLMYAYATNCKNGRTPNFCMIQFVADLPAAADHDNLYFDVMDSENNLFWSSAELQSMRFGVASTLMFNGYYTFSSADTYQAAWWADEFSVKPDGTCVYPTSNTDTVFMDYRGWLGLPTSEAYRVDNTSLQLWTVLKTGTGNNAEDYAWRRDFQNGVALVNPTNSNVTVNFGETLKRLNGRIDPTVNNGQEVTSVTLPAHSGLLLLREHSISYQE